MLDYGKSMNLTGILVPEAVHLVILMLIYSVLLNCIKRLVTLGRDGPLVENVDAAIVVKLIMVMMKLW